MTDLMFLTKTIKLIINDCYIAKKILDYTLDVFFGG